MTATVAPPAQKIDVENPATGKIVASVDVVAPGARSPSWSSGRARAQPGWEALGFEGRARRCSSAARSGSSTTPTAIIETIVSETGKAWEDAQMAEISYAAAAFGFWAKNAEKYLADERVKTASPFVKGRKLIVRHVPVGVVGVIGPWNYPLTNSFGDCIPALAAGNAVHPEAERGHAADRAADGRVRARVRDARGRLPGGARASARPARALIDAVDFVMFTGSTATGKKVMERAARTLTPVALELGGKDPMLVCADADLERAANAAVHYSMQNAGQTCISTERVYVEAPVYDEFVDAGDEEGRGPAPGPAARAGQHRPRRGDPPAAVGHRGGARAATRSRRARAWSRAGTAPTRRALLRADRAGRRGPLDGRACARRPSARRCRS